MMNSVFFAFLAGAFLSLGLIPSAIWLCHRIGFLDRPGHRKIHDAPVPKLGGAALILAVLGALALYFLLYRPSPYPLADLLQLFFILAVTLAMALVGFLDDLYDLKPSLKLVLQFFITGYFVFYGYRFEFLHVPGFTPIGFSYLEVPITMFWMMAVINGFNFMDGVDGLSASVTAVCFLGLGYVSITADEPALQALTFAALGAVLVFLAFNWRPAKIYLGNCGTNALGGLAAAFLVSYHKDASLFIHAAPSLSQQPFPFQLFISTFLVGYPFLESALSTARRGIRRLLFNRSIEWSEKEHIHHQLLKSGIQAPVICLTGFLLQTVFTLGSLLVLSGQKALAVWLLLPVLMFLSYAMARMNFFDFLDSDIIRKYQPHYQIVHHFIVMQKTKLALTVNREEVLALLSQTCAELGVQGFRILIQFDRGEQGRFQYSWERTQDVAREYLSYIHTEVDEGNYGNFKDRISLAEGHSEAEWIFEPHTVEGDLDVEYRVLVSDFMREALVHICSFTNVGPSPDQGVEIGLLSHAKVRSSLLRRKYVKRNE